VIVFTSLLGISVENALLASADSSGDPVIDYFPPRVPSIERKSFSHNDFR